jgi:hypothetical protein
MVADNNAAAMLFPILFFWVIAAGLCAAYLLYLQWRKGGPQ